MIISTGIRELDDFFGDGIPGGILVDVFGSNGTGKTQLAVQTAVHTASRGKKILFQDTTGAFRPERMAEIISENGLDRDLLDRIVTVRTTNVSEQTGSLARIDPGDFSLVVIDNVSDLFFFEYPGEGRFLQRSKTFLRYMKSLASFSVDNGLTVLLTNTVRNVGDRQVENFDKTADMFTHAKIRLETSGSGRRCTCYTAFDGTGFPFEIRPGGIRAAG